MAKIATHKRINLTHEIDRYLGIEEFINALIKAKDSVPSEGSNAYIHLDISQEYGYYDDVYPVVKVNVSYDIPLTEDELAANKLRRQKEAEAKRNEKQMREAREKAEYERLKSKFEGK
jgi:cbb3-type cytochrome oxidase cytochrome c subunit